jgi:hypothetical protein
MLTSATVGAEPKKQDGAYDCAAIEALGCCYAEVKKLSADPKSPVRRTA